jgi:hypothetical protein
MSADVHPSDRLLSDFLLGITDDEAQVELVAHLAECPDCLQRAAGLQPHDTFVDLLASAATRVDGIRGASATPSIDSVDTPTLTFEGPAQAISGPINLPSVLVGHPRYQPVRLLGQGGMGSVWLARHAVMDRPVAIKVIRPECRDLPAAVSRFVREIRAAAGLKSPHIVTAYDAEAVDGTCLLVMEYVPGRNLAEMVEDGPLSETEACRAVRDAARGLAVAHAAGFVHRDVKPSNLIRTPDGVTKVLDFGLVASPTDDWLSPSPAGLVLGTPDYMAPEQAGNPAGADARSDIYALGCTLYHLLAGHAPYQLDSASEKLAVHRDPVRTPPPIPGLTPRLAAILERMLAKDPAARFQSVTEVAAALEPFCVTAEPAAPRRPSRGGWLMAAGLLLGAVTLMAGGVIYKILREKDEITITTDDPEIEVVMKRNGDLVRIVDTKTKQAWELDPAKMRLKPDGGELSVDLAGRDPLTLRRNDDAVVTIRREPVTPTKVANAQPEPDNVPSVEEMHRIPFTYAGWHDFAADGKEFLAFTLHKGKRVAVFFDTITGKETGRFPVPDGNYVGVWFIPGSRDVLVSVDHKVSRWDRSTGQKRQDLMTLQESREGTFVRPLMSADSLYVSVYNAFGPGRHGVFVYDLKTGKERFRIKPLHGHAVLGMFPRQSPDGQLLATTDTTVTASVMRIWEMATGKFVKSIDVPGALNAGIEFSRGEQEVVAVVTLSGINKYCRWDVATGRLMGQCPYKSPEGNIDYSSMLSQSDLAYFEMDGKSVTRFYDTRSGELVRVYRSGEVNHSGVASPDGRFLLYATDTSLRVLRLPTPTAKAK